MADQTQSNPAPQSQESTSEVDNQSLETQEDGASTSEAEGETSSKANKVEAILKDPKASKTAKKEAEKQLKKLRLKVDGEEYDEEFDPNDDEYLTKQLQMAKVAQKRMAEFSSLQKEVVKFVEELKKNPRKALSNPDIGIDVKELAAKIIEEEIAESRKSPEQIDKERLQEELQRMKDEREKEKADAQARDYERLVNEAYERYDILMDQALQKTDLPKEPYIVKKITDYIYLGLQAGKDVTPEDVIPLVRDEIIGDIKHLAQVLPEETLQEIFGDVIKKLRKSNIAKAKSKQAVGSNKALDIAKKSGETEKKSNSKKTFKEFFGV